MRIDLHLHTDRSVDGWSTPQEMVRRAIDRGLDKIAITDHETIEGALAARRLFPDRVVVGEEINCRCGTHLIGLFLSEHVPSGLSIETTAERIRQQGGVVYGPHPFAYVTRTASRGDRVLAASDIVEVFNSRAFLAPWNRRARSGAEKLSLPQAASSDAHFPWELGRAFTELPAFDSAEEFKLAIREARPVGLHTGSPWLHVMSQLVARTRWPRVVGLRLILVPRRAEDRATS